MLSDGSAEKGEERPAVSERRAKNGDRILRDIRRESSKANIDEIRETLGDESADDLVDEAAEVAGRTGVLYTASSTTD